MEDLCSLALLPTQDFNAHTTCAPRWNTPTVTTTRETCCATGCYTPPTATRVTFCATGRQAHCDYYARNLLRHWLSLAPRLLRAKPAAPLAVTPITTRLQHVRLPALPPAGSTNQLTTRHPPSTQSVNLSLAATHAHVSRHCEPPEHRRLAIYMLFRLPRPADLAFNAAEKSYQTSW